MKLTSNKGILAWVIGVFLFLFITNGVPYIYADGFYYYHIAKSVINHQSFISPQEPEYYDYSAYAITKFEDNYVEVVAPGTSFFLLPGLSIANLVRDSGETVTNNYFLAFNGHTLAEGISLLITACFFAIISLILMFKTLITWGYSRFNSLFATFAGYSSSFAIWYVFLQPAYTHTYEIFVFSLVMWGLAKFYKSQSDKFLYIVGVGLGLAFLIRPIFALLAISIGLTFLFKRQIRQLTKLVLSALPALFIWFLYNFVSYGNILSTGYSDLRGETFQSQSNLFNILFSLERGWFSYSPLMIIGMIGLFLWLRKSKAMAFTMIFTSVAIIILYSFWPDWWGGYTFGQRFFLPLVPFMILGIAEVIKYTKELTSKVTLPFNPNKVLMSIILCLTIYSLFLTVFYRFTPVSNLYSEPKGELAAIDRYKVTDILGYQLNNLISASSPADYAQKLYSRANGGESLAVYYLGLSDRVVKIQNPAPGIVDFHFVLPEVISAKDRETKIPGYVEWEDRLYEIVLNINDSQESVGLKCKSACVSGDIEILEVYPSDTSNPFTLKNKNYKCYLLQADQKVCVRVSTGNTIKGPKTNFSNQLRFDLLR